MTAAGDQKLWTYGQYLCNVGSNITIAYALHFTIQTAWLIEWTQVAAVDLGTILLTRINFNSNMDK